MELAILAADARQGAAATAAAGGVKAGAAEAEAERGAAEAAAAAEGCAGKPVSNADAGDVRGLIQEPSRGEAHQAGAAGRDGSSTAQQDEL